MDLVLASESFPYRGEIYEKLKSDIELYSIDIPEAQYNNWAITNVYKFSNKEEYRNYMGYNIKD